MYRYIIKRLLLLIPVIIGASFIIFCIISLAPGDVTTVKAGDASDEVLAEMRDELGLDDPLIVQYGRYLWNLLHGDMGQSYYTNTSVFTEYFAKFPNTLRLAFWSMVLGVAIALPIGIISAIKQYSLLDNCGMIVALVGVSMPVFWEGLLLILLFSLKLGWFPSGGNTLPFSMVLPALTAGTHMAATVTRMTRSSMLEVIRQDYICTARAKGLSEKVVILKHAFRNALIPIVTTTGITFGTAIGGALVTETVFSWPGVGRLVVESINRRDTPMIMGCIILTTVCICIINLVVDILYAYIDPRIKAQYKGTR
ncbi:MAG: peptide ABC transporter permease [Oscillospiraceae bacterium]|nr:MAG: peptide ABC transporter permease [Oscillospiraceae bacterium]